MATQKAVNLPPIWERSSVTTTKVHVYVNGDNKNPGKEININKRTCPNFDIWLDQLTLTIKPRTGAIRRLFTPRAGHRVNSLDRLQNGDKLVAGGYEEFKPCDYEHITYPKKGGPRVSYDVEPGHNSRYNVSARFRKVDSKALRIQCWVNGVPSLGAKPISIRQVGRPMTMDVVMNDVHCKMKDMFRQPVGRLYTSDGQLVKDLGQIEHHGCYVAAGEREHFKQGNYRDRSLPTNMSSSPSPRRSDRLPPITRSNKTSSQSSPEHSISSNNGSENSYTQRYRRERAKREEDGVFHARPVKHKRSSEKVRRADYDQDQGGVFKAKSQNRATKGAKQVEDSGQTKTDLPVDQRPAEEVKEDVKKKDKKDKKGKKQEENGSTHRYQDQDRTYRANARRPDSPSNQQARQEAEREARLKREAEDRERLEKTRQKQEAARQRKEEKDQKKREEENEKRKREEENEKRKREEEEEKRKREEEEERRQEEIRRRREEVEEERRMREEEERLWREEEARNAAEASRRNEYEDRPPEYSSAPRQSSYRSGTDLLQDEQRREERDNRTPDRETERGRNSRTDENRDNPNRADEMDWGPGLEELRSMEEEERARAATTIQAHYRGMKTRQEYREMQLARGLGQYP